jgi:hypothetical protein
MVQGPIESMNKGPFNNNVDKMRGQGVKKCLFYPRSGYKNCPRKEGEGVTSERCTSDQLNTFFITKGYLYWSEVHLSEVTSYKIHRYFRISQFSDHSNWSMYTNTDYGHTKAKSLILNSPNSNPNRYEGLVFDRNNG